MQRLPRILLLLTVAGALTLGPAVPAGAACHEFRFDRDAYTVAEGAGSITITVSRDAGLAPSSIGYETRDGTAKAGQDYTARSGTLEYSTQISMSFSVPITNDARDEPNETFEVRLHDPSGCAPNRSYDVDDPSTVTITDDDAPPPAPPPPPPPPTESPATSPTASASSPSPTVTSTPTPSATPSHSPTSPSADPETTGPVAGVEPAGDRADGNGPGLAAIVAAALVVAVGGALVARRRTRV